MSDEELAAVIERVEYRHKPRTDSDECRVPGDGPWPCASVILANEVKRLHSWVGLMSLLDEHWPDDIFPRVSPWDQDRDPGPRIISLIRWLDDARNTNTELREANAAVRRQRNRATAEANRLRGESVHAPAAMYGKPGREPICDFDCDYCHEDEPEGLDDENLRTWRDGSGDPLFAPSGGDPAMNKPFLNVGEGEYGIGEEK